MKIALPRTLRNVVALVLVASAAIGCGDDDSAGMTGALESLGEYKVTDNTCGSHWDGTYAFSANRVAQFGQGTDQLFVEPTDPSSAANRGLGKLASNGNFSLQMPFEVTGKLLVYECMGALDKRAVLMQCEQASQPCQVSFTAQ